MPYISSHISVFGCYRTRRCLNYYLTLGPSYTVEVTEKGGLGILLQALSLAAQGDSTAYQELAQVSA